MAKFRRQFDKKYTGTPGEVNNQPSMTVPDMNLTVRQLLENHSRGILTEVKHYDGQYFGVEIPNFDDITEMVQYKIDLEEKAKEMAKAIQEQQKAQKEKAKAEAEEKKKVQENPLKTSNNEESTTAESTKTSEGE